MFETVQELCEVVSNTHHCSATHFDAVPIIEKMGDKIVWDGVVHVFNLEGHSKASRCYAWTLGDEGGETRYVTVLNSPPVNSAHAALRAAIASGQQR